MFWQTNLLYEFGPFRVDARERRVLCDGEVVPLTPKVFDILLILVKNSGHILGKDDVMKAVWPDAVVEEANISRNISTLRKALGESPHECQYIETIPWRGYRFVANVKEVRDPYANPAIDSIAVLPFVDVTPNADTDFLSDGITESLIAKLSQLTNLKVMSRNSVFRFKGRETDAQAAGRELKVRAVLTGRVADRGDLLSISVELVDASDGRHIWGAQYMRKPADIFTMQETISREIAEKLRLKLTSDERQRLTKRHTENTEAYLLYLRGRYHFNKLTMDGVQKGIEHFHQAIDIDPGYALAYAGLGDGHNYLAHPMEAKKAVVRALELDETLGEAHASSGFFRFLYDWDFAGAESEFKQALELNSNYAESHHWYAVYLANMGRHDEASAEAKRAVELDPLSLLMNMTPALNCYVARQYDQAVEALLKVIDMEPNFPAAHSVLGSVYEQKGMYEKAIAEYQKVMQLSEGVATVEATMKAIIARAYAGWGKTRETTKLIAELTTGGDVTPFLMAEVYSSLGEKDQAFGCLNKAYEQRDLQLVSLKVTPTLDKLRADPRFADLVRRVGLPQ